MASSLNTEFATAPPKLDSPVFDVPSEVEVVKESHFSIRRALHHRRRLIAGIAVFGLLTALAMIASPVAVQNQRWPEMVAPGLAGLGGGLFFGIGLAVMIDFRDRANSKKAYFSLGLPTLARIPQIERSVVRSVLAEGETRLSPMLVSHHRPSNLVSDRFRGLSSRLLSDRQDRDVTIIQFVSARRGDGATTTLANLALSLVQSGQRILVVDCDFQSAMLHAHFGMDSCDGYLEVVQEDVELSDAIHACAEVPGLYVLPAGRRPSIYRELPDTSYLSVMLKELRGEFDCILVDCPPVSVTEESIDIATACDATVIVVNPNGSQPEIKKAVTTLRAHNVCIAGVVLNQVTEQNSEARSDSEAWDFFLRPARSQATMRVDNVSETVH